MRHLKYIEVLNEADFHGSGRQMGKRISHYEDFDAVYVRDSNRELREWHCEMHHNAGQKPAEFFNKDKSPFDKRKGLLSCQIALCPSIKNIIISISST